MALPSNMKELSAKEQQAMGLPEGFKQFTPFPFDGMDQSNSRMGMADKDLFYVENFTRLGDGNYRTLWDVGTALYAAPNGKTIIMFFFYNIGATNYVIVFLSDGTAIQVNTASGANTTVSSVANTFYNTGVSTQLPACCQWGSSYLLIANNITQNSYWVWDGDDLHNAGTLAPQVVLTATGSGYVSAPTVTAFGGHGSGATFLATVLNGSVVNIALTNPGTGYEPGDNPQLFITGGGTDSGAELTAVLTSGSIASVSITNPGTGYTPGVYNLTFGSGAATGTYTVDATGTVVSTQITSGGSGYTGSPAVTFVSGGGSNAAGVANLSATSVASVSVVSGGTNFLTTPTITFVGGGGSGAAGTAVLTGNAISSVTISNGGSGYTSAPAVVVQSGVNNAASGTITIMPYGVSGSSMETFESRVWLMYPFQSSGNGVTQTGGTFNVSAPGSFTDFATSSGGLNFISTDPFLRAQYTNIKQSNGYLYPFGDSSVSVISNVQTSGTPTTTTFNYQNTDPQVGTSWRDTCNPFSRTILFGNPLGIFGLYGGAVTKVSGKIDQIFTNAVSPANGGLTPTSAVANIFSKKIYAQLMTFKDPFTQAQVNKMVCWDEKDFFIASQGVSLTYIGTQEISSNLAAWGTDGNALYQMFSTPSATLSKKMSTKLYGTEDLVIKKRAYTFMFQGQDMSSGLSGIALNVNIDTNFTDPNTGKNSYAIPFPVSIQAAPPTYPFVSTASGDIYAMNLGATITSTSSDFVVNFVGIGYLNQVAETSIQGG